MKSKNYKITLDLDWISNKLIELGLSLDEKGEVNKNWTDEMTNELNPL